ncbi:hypothetical protein, partial [Actinobacillus pleuropneumoniae]
DKEIQSALPKLVIRHREELLHNKQKNGLGYDKDVSFHIPDYSNPIQFQSAGLLHDNPPSVVQNSAPSHSQSKVVKCQHCD